MKYWNPSPIVRYSKLYSVRLYIYIPDMSVTYPCSVRTARRLLVLYAAPCMVHCQKRATDDRGMGHWELGHIKVHRSLDGGRDEAFEYYFTGSMNLAQHGPRSKEHTSSVAETLFKVRRPIKCVLANSTISIKIYK